MKISIVSALFLWGVAGYGAISIALAGSPGLDSGIERRFVIPPQEAIHSITDASMLFLSVGAEEKPITNSNLQLIGVFFSADEAKSLALFNIGNQIAKPFRVGSIVPNGMKVHSISQREVGLIDTDGKIVSINMPKK